MRFICGPHNNNEKCFYESNSDFMNCFRYIFHDYNIYLNFQALAIPCDCVLLARFVSDLVANFEDTYWEHYTTLHNCTKGVTFIYIARTCLYIIRKKSKKISISKEIKTTHKPTEDIMHFLILIL